MSNVYQTMKIETLSGMIPFFDFSVVEKIAVDAVKQKFVSMKVDHMKNVVIFCKTVCCSFCCGCLPLKLKTLQKVLAILC